MTALHLSLLASYSVLYPSYLGYDEPQHVDMVVALQHGDGWPGPGERTLSQGVARSSQPFVDGSYADHRFANKHVPKRDQRPSLRALGGDSPSTGRMPNQIVQHPPMYYAMGALLLDAVPGSASWPFDRTVAVLRLLSILLVAPLPLLAWSAARRLTDSTAVQQAAAVAPLAIPGLTRVGATVSNDNLLTLAVGGLTVVLASVVAGDLRLRTGAWAGLLLALALLSKGFALVLPLVVIVAYVLGWRRVRGPLPWRPAALAVSVGGAVGGWWWLRNLFLYGSVQINGLTPTPPAPQPGPLPHGYSFAKWLGYFSEYMTNRFWSGLGLPEPPRMAWLWIWIATGVLGVGCLVAVVAGRRLKVSRLGLGALLLPPLLVYLGTARSSWKDYKRLLTPLGVQGRYLYLAVIAIAVVTTIGLHRLLGRLGRALPLLVLLGAFAMQALALDALVSYFWLRPGTRLGPGNAGDAFHGIDQWSPWPTPVTVMPMLAAAVLALATLAMTLRAVVRPEPPDGGQVVHPCGAETAPLAAQATT